MDYWIDLHVTYDYYIFIIAKHTCVYMYSTWLLYNLCTFVKFTTQFTYLHCLCVQQVAESCVQCSVKFARYVCLVCNLFDDAEKGQYHCAKCGICRLV